jgi:hypothetical protein
MQTLFIFIYECLCGRNQNISDYRERIFGSVGWLTLLAALTVGLIFYLGLGRWRNVWHTRIHWSVTIVLCALIGFGLAYGPAKSMIGSVDGYLVLFSCMNAFVSVVYFMLFSFLLKRFSIHAKRTPF